MIFAHGGVVGGVRQAHMLASCLECILKSAPNFSARSVYLELISRRKGMEEKSGYHYSSSCFPTGENGNATAITRAKQRHFTYILAVCTSPLPHQLPSLVSLLDHRPTSLWLFIIGKASVAGLRGVIIIITRTMITSQRDAKVCHGSEWKGNRQDN